MTIYERINPFGKLHYSIFWILVGVAFFVIQHLLAQFSGDPRYLLVRLLIAGTTPLITITGSIVGSAFYKALISAKSIIDMPTESYQSWAKDRFDELFNFKGNKVKLAILLVFIIGEFVIVYVGLPYDSTISNIAYLISVQVMIFVGSHALYALLGMLYTLYEITDFPLKVPFYANRHRSILCLSNAYNIGAFLTLVDYIWLLTMVYLAPWLRLDYVPLVALSIVGFYPLAMFLVSFFQIHAILKKIKQNHIDMINQQIEVCYRKLESRPSKDRLEELQKLMDIQEKVEKRPDWPFDIGNISTFIVSLIIPSVNVALSVFGLL
jgi:hypothetical protein